MIAFADFHHGALARFLFYLFADRLGHTMYFPSIELLMKAQAGHNGIWGPVTPVTPLRIGIKQEEWDGKGFIVDSDEFEATQWDIVIMSRRESEAVFKRLGHPKPGTIYIGVSGNEGTSYDPDWVKNFIGTDLRSFNACSRNVHKIHIPQELGRLYDQGFVPIAPEYLRTVNSFINNLKGFDQGIRVRSHPQPVNIFRLWLELRELLPEYTLNCYGHGNQELLGCPAIDEVGLVKQYQRCALTWHFKTCEGYGHSLLQSLPAGRPVLVPHSFYDDRTAGRYLIEGETCIKCDYDAQDIANKIRAATTSLEQVNTAARRCYDAYKRMFDWQADAEKIREWLAQCRIEGGDNA